MIFSCLIYSSFIFSFNPNEIDPPKKKELKQANKTTIRGEMRQDAYLSWFAQFIFFVAIFNFAKIMGIP